ncbi:hypothetical protein EJB05_14541, partial [Eragrostis curvula]
MEVILSAIMSDLAGRSVSFLMDRILNHRSEESDGGDETETLDRLRRLLLRVHVVVEEAEARRVTNRAMLRQLSGLREEMYRGCHALDEPWPDGAGAAASAMASRSCRTRRPPPLQLQQVLGSLEAVFTDVKDEFVALLAGCMLPISGPKRAGKSTLVEHACNDERVRGHFSQIVSLSRGNLGDENIALTSTTTTLTTSCCEERVLLIVELDGDRNTKGLEWDLNEALLRRFFSTFKIRTTPRVSKIIVTSRSDKVASFGTTDLLRLRPFTEEAFWYFFKARAFGSADASEHPKMVSVAMDMVEEMSGSFAAANFFGGLLRSNFNTGFWSLALAVFRGLKQTKLVVVHDRAQQTATTSTGTEIWEEVTEPACPFAVEGVPKVSLRDVLFGGARPQGKFDVLAWKSPVPPHYRYAYSCEIRSSHSTVARKNRLVMHKKTGS